MKIIEIDAHDDVALSAWYDVYALGAGADREDPPLWALPELSVWVRAADSTEHRLYAATEGDELTGVGRLSLPTRDNTDLAQVEIDVPPEHRGRGIGGALFDALQERAEEGGRHLLGAEVNQALGRHAEPAPAARFVQERGFTKRTAAIRRRLDLPVENLDELAAHAAERSADYRIVRWSGPCPDEYAERYAELKALLLVETETGDLEFEPEKWDVERLRAQEQVTAEQDRTLLTAVALAPDDTLAGHTQIAVTPHDPDRAYQWDTLVLPDHRGHRLGLTLKVANLQELAASFPEVTALETWNAEQNGPMVAVNDRLGFRRLERLEDWQRRR